MDPHYFKQELTFSEAKLYMEGVNRRYRQGWEQTRFEVGCIIKALTGEAIDINFPWDDEKEEDDDLTEEEIQELLAREQIRINKKDGSNNNIQKSE